MAVKQFLKTREGKQVWPISVTECIYDRETNKNLAEILKEQHNGLDEAKKYADQKINDLINGAPEAMNTLNELADAIEANKDIYDAYVAQHVQDMADLKAELQSEIDADVLVEANRAMAAEQNLDDNKVDKMEGYSLIADADMAKMVLFADSLDMNEYDDIVEQPQE